MAKWSELPGKSQFGIVVGLAIGLTTALWFTVYKDMGDQNTQTASKLKAVQADNAQLRSYVGKLADMDRQIETLKEQIEIQKKIVPDEKEADNFIRLVQGAANGAGIEIRRYTTRPTSGKEFYVEAPYELEIDGPFFSVLSFFDRMAKLERIINIGTLQMASIVEPKNAKAKHSYKYAPSESVVATCVATTYFSHEPAGAAARPASATPVAAGK